jgi:EAL domain-containing protein (putative c-di-GMP-specific phosphodiesterase class I)
VVVLTAANQISESMVVAIPQVAKVMGLRTIAEHVEFAPAHTRTGIAVKLGETGVDYGHGVHPGRPQPLSDVLAGLAASSPKQDVVAGWPDCCCHRMVDP